MKQGNISIIYWNIYQRKLKEKPFVDVQKEYRRLKEQDQPYSNTSNFVDRMLPQVTLQMGVSAGNSSVGKVDVSVSTDLTQGIRGMAKDFDVHQTSQHKRQLEEAAIRYTDLEKEASNYALLMVSNEGYDAKVAVTDFALMRQGDLISKDAPTKAINNAKFQVDQAEHDLRNYQFRTIDKKLVDNANDLQSLKAKQLELFQQQKKANDLLQKNAEAYQKGQKQLISDIREVKTTVLKEQKNTRKETKGLSTKLSEINTSLGIRLDEYNAQLCECLDEYSTKLETLVDFVKETKTQQAQAAQEKIKVENFEKHMRDLDGISEACGFINELGRVTGSKELQQLAAIGNFFVKIAQASALLDLPAYSGLAALGPIGMVAGAGLMVFSVFSDSQSAEQVMLKYLQQIEKRLDMLDKKIDHLQNTVEFGFKEMRQSFSQVMHSIRQLTYQIHYSLTLPVIGSLHTLSSDVKLILKMLDDLNEFVVLNDMHNALMEVNSYWNMNEETGRSKASLSMDSGGRLHYEKVAKQLAEYATNKAKHSSLTRSRFVSGSPKQKSEIIASTNLSSEKLEALIGFIANEASELANTDSDYKGWQGRETLAHPRVWMEAAIAYAKLTFLGIEVYGSDQLPFNEAIDGLTKEGERLKAFIHHLQTDPAFYIALVRRLQANAKILRLHLENRYNAHDASSVKEMLEGQPQVKYLFDPEFSLKYPPSSFIHLIGYGAAPSAQHDNWKLESLLTIHKFLGLILKTDKINHVEDVFFLPPHKGEGYLYAPSFAYPARGGMSLDTFIYSMFPPEIILAYQFGLMKLKTTVYGTASMGKTRVERGSEIVLTVGSDKEYLPKIKAQWGFYTSYEGLGSLENIPTHILTKELPYERRHLGIPNPCSGHDHHCVPLLLEVAANNTFRAALPKQISERILASFNTKWVNARQEVHRRLLAETKDFSPYHQFHADLLLLMACMRIAGFPEEEVTSLFKKQMSLTVEDTFSAYSDPPKGSTEVTVTTPMPVLSMIDDLKAIEKDANVLFPEALTKAVEENRQLQSDDYFRSYTLARVHQGLLWLDVLKMALNQARLPVSNEKAQPNNDWGDYFTLKFNAWFSSEEPESPAGDHSFSTQTKRDDLFDSFFSTSDVDIDGVDVSVVEFEDPFLGISLSEVVDERDNHNQFVGESSWKVLSSALAAKYISSAQTYHRGWSSWHQSYDKAASRHYTRANFSTSAATRSAGFFKVPSRTMSIVVKNPLLRQLPTMLKLGRCLMR